MTDTVARSARDGGVMFQRTARTPHAAVRDAYDAIKEARDLARRFPAESFHVFFVEPGEPVPAEPTVIVDSRRSQVYHAAEADARPDPIPVEPPAREPAPLL